MLRGVWVASRSTVLRWGRRAPGPMRVRESAAGGVGVLGFGVPGGEVLAGLPDAGGCGATVVAAGRDPADAMDGAVHAGVAGTAVGAGRDGGSAAEAGGTVGGGSGGGLFWGGGVT